ncbi:MAG TPA: VOC family protein [Burkholderiales bacterium]|nr:VOC family protein [Burkholderiales bacterium]
MTPLWPARLHYLRRSSAEPERLARWYGALLGDRVEPLPGGEWLVQGHARRLVVGHGAPGGVPEIALAMRDAAHLAAHAAALDAAGVARAPARSPLLLDGATAVTDPDGRRVLFGLPVRVAGLQSRLPGRLQHFVCASTRVPEMLAFWRDKLGARESDRVLEGEELAAVFLRSDPEHHVFATFRAPASRPDHHAYETGGWMDIRDWGDHVAGLRIPMWWGPGRHGPGNNLFFMIEDPDGYKVEFSAELELMPEGAAFRTWPHEERTLNLWGSAWMRS